MISKEIIDQYFKARERRYLKRTENIWHTGFHGRIQNYRKDFEMFVHLDDDWVYLQTPIMREVNEECKAALDDFLLELNFQSFLVKFCQEKRRILITVDLPRSCGGEQLNDAVWAIEEYTNRYFLEIMTIAIDRNVAALWLIRDRLVGTTAVSQEEVPDIIFN